MRSLRDADRGHPGSAPAADRRGRGRSDPSRRGTPHCLAPERPQLLDVERRDAIGLSAEVFGSRLGYRPSLRGTRAHGVRLRSPPPGAFRQSDRVTLCSRRGPVRGRVLLRRPVSAARIVCGNQPVALINASSDAPSSLESISITSACLEPVGGEIRRIHAVSDPDRIAAGARD
jgi:hypothetical protein